MPKYAIEESELIAPIKEKVLTMLKTPKTTLQLKRPNDKGEMLERANPREEGTDASTIARFYDEDEKLVERAIQELKSEGRIKEVK